MYASRQHSPSPSNSFTNRLHEDLNSFRDTTRGVGGGGRNCFASGGWVTLVKRRIQRGMKQLYFISLFIFTTTSEKNKQDEWQRDKKTRTQPDASEPQQKFAALKLNHSGKSPDRNR